MKILHTTFGYLPAVSWGGPVKVVQHNSLELVRRGHEVTVCCSNLLDKKARIQDGNFERNIEGIHVVYLNTYLFPDWPGTTGPTMLTPRALRTLFREVQQADIVHLHGTRDIVVIASAYFALLLKKPLILQPHGTLQYIVNSIRLKRLFDALFLNRVVARVQRLIALTSSEYEQIRSAGGDPKKIVVVPNGFYTNGFQREKYEGGFRQRFNITPDQRIILFLGRINRKKGTDLLVKAFAAMDHEQRRNTRLVIAGPDDGQLDEVKTLIQAHDLSDEVLLTGLLAGDEVTSAFVDADIFVLPCRTDTFPMALLEACQAGTPIIVSETCEMAQILDGVAATVVPVGTTSIASAMNTLLSDPALRQRYRHGGPELIQTQLSVSRVAEQLEEIYSQIT